MLDIVGIWDIARMAFVTESAVCNWRKRHNDFPEPCAYPSKTPVWYRSDVKAWLVAKGKVKA